MTISHHVRELNTRLTNLEDCAINAPDGTYAEAKRAAELIDDISNEILSQFRAAGFKASNGDKLRNIEAAIYGYLLESNPDEYGLTTGEGFGEAMNGPARERVLAGCIRDRDFLSNITAARAKGAI